MILNGTHFNDCTSLRVGTLLENLRQNKTRVKLCFGDTQTGEDWEEKFDTVGRIGRSTGPKMVPLLIHNSRSTCGVAILTHCIVKISESKGGKILYQHLKYHRGAK